MRIPIAAGNWKMHFGPRQAAQFAHVLRDSLATISGVEVVLIPPFISIPAVHQVIAGTSIGLGAQNLADQPGGAYTGEVAAGMIAEFCQWVIVGHSERRGYYGETDEIVQRKTLLALEHGLRPIVCVGEQLADRDANLTERVLTAQVRGSLGGLPAEHLGAVTVAYEPVWAIGTGRAATRQDAEDAIQLIRALIREHYGPSVSDAMRILYGGSASAANIGDYMASVHIDGALIGGASLKPEFIEIARTIAAAR
jgi:triosephosphate isomerase (TIM)